jgi:hypothetical protein
MIYTKNVCRIHHLVLGVHHYLSDLIVVLASKEDLTEDNAARYQPDVWTALWMR